METLLVLTYAAICIGVFKAFKIPLTKWTVPTAVLGGIVLVGALVFGMNYNHPYSETTREYFVTTPVLPYVRGRVIEVPIEPNQLLQEGDVLFRIDPEPYQHRVDNLDAQLVSAQEDLKRAQSLAKTGSGSKRNVDLAQASVNSLQAQLQEASYNLDQTVVRAPSTGFVSQMFLRPGMQVMPMPLRPVMTFVPVEARQFVGWFRQNSMLRLQAGSNAEIAFDGIPGHVFSGRVVGALPVMAEGELQANGRLLNEAAHIQAGRIPVIIEIDDPEFEQFRQQVPGGAFGQAAIYSEHLHHLAIMRKILLRMSSWMNYFFPFH